MSFLRFTGAGLALGALVFFAFIDRPRAHDAPCARALAPTVGPYRVRYETAPDGTPTLNFSGALALEPHFDRRFLAALEKLPREGRVLIALDGAGGSFGAHRIVARAIESHLRPHVLRRGRNARIVTYVPEGAVCLGDCLRLFMLGHERLAHPTARFGFRRATGLGRVGHTVRELRAWGVRGPLLARLRREGAFNDPKQFKLTDVAGVADSNLLTAPPVDLRVTRFAGP